MTSFGARLRPGLRPQRGLFLPLLRVLVGELRATTGQDGCDQRRPDHRVSARRTEALVSVAGSDCHGRRPYRVTG
ncbi:hypothetical protein GCM10027444_24260 [Actinopolyspora lacussalsi]